MKKMIFSVLMLACTAVFAQNFPTKKVSFVSGVSPGSASDTMARILADKLQAKWGHPVVVENRLGAGGLVGAKYVAQAEPDGHTIMMYASAFTVSTLLSPQVLEAKDMQPVAMVATIPTVLVAAPDKGYKSVADLVAAAKAKQGGIICSNAGTGSATHMNLERFRFSAGIDVVSIPTKGVSEALTEVISGRADCYFALVFQAKRMADDNKVVALAHGSPKRSTLMPNLPTTLELGFANSDYNFWVGALVSSKTPRPIVDRLHADITGLVETAEVQAAIRKLGCDPLPMTVRGFEELVQKELAENADLIRRANIKAN